MTLNKSEKQFILRNRDALVSLFSKRINELKTLAFNLKRGDERDVVIEMIKEFQNWLISIKIVDNEKELEKKDEFI